MVKLIKGLFYLAAAAFFVLVGTRQSSAAPASVTHYIITNDDVAGEDRINTSTFFTSGAGGALKVATSINLGGTGINGGYFGTPRVAVLESSKQNCVFLSNAFSGTIAGVSITTRKVSGDFAGSKTDAGTINGIGMVVNHSYLYASYTDSNTIGTFNVHSGCKLKFVGDISVEGLQGGVIDGMALHDTMLVVTYGDGSIESFNTSNGVPVSNADEQNSTGSKGGNTYPNSVDISQDGHYALFGDTATSTIIEVSDISSGALTPTLVYHLGSAISSSNILLSPDETLLYISNTQGDRITAAFFDSATGVLSAGCRSGLLKGYVTDWSYLGGLALARAAGTGSVVYAAEFGAPSSIAIVKVKSSGGVCTLKEAPDSPAQDGASSGLQSLGFYPPRKF